jgi:hypothetical protein
MRLVGPSVLAALSLFASVASADDVDRCVAASERGQSSRRRGALSDARDAFIQCSANKCPAVVRAACVEWLDQVDAVIPSVVVAVTAPDGTDLASARVLIDGRRIPHGKSEALDPGSHTIDVEADGYESASQPFLAREGERNRSIRISLAKRKVAVFEAPAPRSRPESRSDTSVGASPVTWITGGLAVVALGSFAYFGLSGRARASELRDQCAPSCPLSERDAVQTKYVIADVSLLAAVVLGGVSVWTLLSRPTPERSTARQ